MNAFKIIWLALLAWAVCMPIYQIYKRRKK